MAGDLGQVGALDEIDGRAVEARLRRIRDVIGDRQRYLEFRPDPGWPTR